MSMLVFPEWLPASNPSSQCALYRNALVVNCLDLRIPNNASRAHNDGRGKNKLAQYAPLCQVQQARINAHLLPKASSELRLDLGDLTMRTFA
jgi:hypothetical protein